MFTSASSTESTSIWWSKSVSEQPSGKWGFIVKVIVKDYTLLTNNYIQIDFVPISRVQMGYEFIGQQAA